MLVILIFRTKLEPWSFKLNLFVKSLSNSRVWSLIVSSTVVHNDAATRAAKTIRGARGKIISGAPMTSLFLTKKLKAGGQYSKALKILPNRLGPSIPYIRLNFDGAMLNFKAISDSN